MFRVSGYHFEMYRIDSNYECSNERAMQLNLPCRISDIYQKTILINMGKKTRLESLFVPKYNEILTAFMLLSLGSRSCVSAASMLGLQLKYQNAAVANNVH